MWQEDGENDANAEQEQVQHHHMLPTENKQGNECEGDHKDDENHD